MVTKTVNFKQVPEELDKMLHNMMKESGKTRAKSTAQAGNFMVKTAKSYAPVDSGATKAGIIGFKSGKNYIVESSVANTYKENAFADGRIKGRGKGGNVYYKSVHRTGVKPDSKGYGFFTQAKIRTQDFFSRIIIKDVSSWKILK